MPCFPKQWFLAPIDAELLCSVCGDVMNQPLQLPCGHDCGAGCVAGEACGQSAGTTEIRVAARMIAKLIVSCRRRCGWEGPCAEIDHHHCPLDSVPCPFNCGFTVERRALPQHKEECPFRVTECPHCFRQLRVHDVAAHDARCALRPVACVHCGAQVRRGEMEKHIQIECLDAVVGCPFEEFGCSVRIPRRALDEHIATALGDHCCVLVEHVRREQQRSADVAAGLRARIAELEAAIEGSVAVDGVPLGDAIRRLQEQVVEQQSQCATILEGRLLTVDASGRCGMFQRIGDALDACRRGDCIVVRPGVYSEVVELLPQHEGVTLRGTASDATFLNGRMVVKCSATVASMSIVNRLDRNAPALRVVSGVPVFTSLSITSVNLSCCQVDGGSPKFVDCSLSGSQQYGVLWRSVGQEGAACGSMESTTVSDCGQSNVCIERGALLLSSCDIFGSKGNGVSVGRSAQCNIESSAIHDNMCSNVDAQPNCQLSLDDASIFRSEKCGLFVAGHAVVRGSKIFENQLPNVFVVDGGSVALEASKVLCGLQHGVVVKRGGAVAFRGCVVSGNCLDNVAAEEGAQVDM